MHHPPLFRYTIVDALSVLDRYIEPDTGGVRVTVPLGGIIRIYEFEPNQRIC